MADGRAVIGARLMDNTTYLPLRSVCEDAGYSVSWDAALNAASVSGEDLRMTVAPGANAVIAAKLALEGADPAGGSLFFLNPSIAKSSWIQRNRTFFVRIGRREFYL